MMAESKPIKPADYDERVYRKGVPPHRARIALIAIVLLLIGTYLAWTKELPFGDDYELGAQFENAVNVRADSPVRIAGVNVGEVKSVEREGGTSVVTFTVKEEGRPIKEDAEVHIRPRIFLEGNFFLDLRPGSPSAPELEDGGVVPITRTATAVQLDEILTTLQEPDRENLKALLEGYGTGLNSRPTAAEDADQDPDVRGETAAEAINDSFRYGAAAGRDSAIVSEALQGTEPHDLSRMLAASNDVFATLATTEGQLQDLITNFNITAGALAAESENLGESVRLLAPTLETAEPSLSNLSAALPALRAFARDIEPGVAELPATIAASPEWLRQTGSLMRRRHLGYIAEQLRRIGFGLGRFNSATLGWLPQLRRLSLCATETLLPTGDVVIDDAGGAYPYTTGVPNYKEALYGVVGFAGESQTFDGNGPYLRLQSGGGGVMARAANPIGTPFPFPSNELFTSTPDEPIGTRPAKGSTPPFRTDVRCHTNGVPNINGPASAIAPPTPAAIP